MSVIFKNIPASLRAYPARWSTCIFQARPGRVDRTDKIPVAVDGRRLSTAHPDGWGSYADLEGLEDAPALGFRMTDAPDGLVGVDLDHCLTPEGYMEPWVREIVDRAQTYTEVSPSGRGLRLFGFSPSGAVEDWANHHRGVEVYGGTVPRYLTVTGRRLASVPADVCPVPHDFLHWLRTAHGNPAAPTKAAAEPRPDILEGVGAWPPMSRAAYDFLMGEAVEDRSAMVARVARELAHAHLSPQQVLSTLWASDVVRQVALDHRRGDEERALDWVWQHSVIPTKLPTLASLGLGGDRPPGASPEPVAQTVKVAQLDLRCGSVAELQYAALTAPVIIKGYLYADVGVLLAAGGTGKSTLQLWEAAHIILGRDLYGLPVLKSGPVVYVTAEDPREIVLGRYREVLKSLGLSPADQEKARQGLLVLDASASGISLAVSTGRDTLGPSGLADALIAACAERPPVLVVFDPLAAFGPGERFFNDGAREVLREARKISQSLGCAVRFAAHMGKANARAAQIDQYSLRDGSAFADGSRMVTSLRAGHDEDKHTGHDTPWPEGPDLVLRVHKSTYDRAAFGGILCLRRRGFFFEHHCGGDPVDILDKKVLEYMTECEKLGKVMTMYGVQSATEILGAPKARIQTTVVKLIAEGRIAQGDYEKTGFGKTVRRPLTVVHGG